MNFDWDNNKNQSNINKHGISFEEAITIFDDPNILSYEDTRFNYGETRFISIGQITLVRKDCDHRGYSYPKKSNNSSDISQKSQ
jgi:uncharacterized DUF497 family protein